MPTPLERAPSLAPSSNGEGVLASPSLVQDTLAPYEPTPAKPWNARRVAWVDWGGDGEVDEGVVS